MYVSRTLAPKGLLLPLALLPLAACSDSGSGSSSSFVVRSTDQAIDGATPVVVIGSWMVYFADEAFSGATDLNMDGDTIDDVAVAVDLLRAQETTLRAAKSATAVGNEIYLEVDEAVDGMDWDGDMVMDDTVLLHWSSTAGVVTFVDVLSAETEDVGMVPVETRLYYTAEATMLTGDETALRYLEQAAPTTPVTVMNATGGGVLEPILLGEDDGLLFLFLDEAEESADLNGDADMSDGFVLALLDATDSMGTLVNVGLALLDEDEPFAAYPTAANDWLVAFLVDETAQGGTNLNDQGLFVQPLLPTPCAITPDTDTNDRVLHYLKVADFVSAMPDALINTGLAGTGRVLAINGYVGTLSDEGDANCDLNQDTDMSDQMPRWIAATSTFNTGSMQYTGVPPRDPSQMYAVATSLPGGSMGFTHLGNRWIAVVDEAADGRNSDGKAADHDLVAWLDPTVGAWNFAHQRAGVPSHGTGVFDSGGFSEPYAGASWMAKDPQWGRIGIAFQEEVPGTNPLVSSLNNNLECNLFVKDMDLTDSLPTWCDFEGGPTLDFDGLGFAVNENNAGLVITQTHAFYRLSEASDNVDHNNDGDKIDDVLMRNPLTTCSPVVMGTASSVLGDAIFTDGVRGGAFITSEFQSGVDLNMDGDTNDEVVRYFAF